MSPQQQFSDMPAMKANRKVMEAPCLGCGGAFMFGENVRGGTDYGGYFHEQCLAAAAAEPAHAEVYAEPVYADAPAYGFPPAAPAEAPPALPVAAEGEKPCTQCGRIVRADAMKCRFCGHILDSALVSHDPPQAIIDTIRSNANTALTCGIIGLFICGPVLGSMAISNANKAIRELDNYPLYVGPRGKANAGLILGWLDWILLGLFFIIKVSNTR